jgi:hypothetical protein
MEEESVSGQRESLVLFRMVRVSKDVLIALDVFGVGDEGDGGVGHDQGLVREDVSDKTDDLATLRQEVRVQLRVDRHQTHQLPQLLLVAQQVQSRQSGQFAVVEIQYFAGELGLHLLEDELCVQESIGKQANLAFMAAVGDVLVEFAVDDHSLCEEKSTQLVHPHASPALLHLQDCLPFPPLDRHRVVVLGKQGRVDQLCLLPAGKDEAGIETPLHSVGTDPFV